MLFFNFSDITKGWPEQEKYGNKIINLKAKSLYSCSSFQLCTASQCKFLLILNLFFFLLKGKTCNEVQVNLVIPEITLQCKTCTVTQEHAKWPHNTTILYFVCSQFQNHFQQNIKKCFSLQFNLDHGWKFFQTINQYINHKPQHCTLSVCIPAAAETDLIVQVSPADHLLQDVVQLLEITTSPMQNR